MTSCMPMTATTRSSPATEGTRARQPGRRRGPRASAATTRSCTVTSAGTGQRRPGPGRRLRRHRRGHPLRWSRRRLPARRQPERPPLGWPRAGRAVRRRRQRPAPRRQGDDLRLYGQAGDDRLDGGPGTDSDCQGAPDADGDGVADVGADAVVDADQIRRCESNRQTPRPADAGRGRWSLERASMPGPGDGARHRPRPGPRRTSRGRTG